MKRRIQNTHTETHLNRRRDISRMTLPFVNVGVRVTLFMHGMEPGSIMEHRATEYWQCTRTRTITLSTEMKRRKKKIAPTHRRRKKKNDSILIKVYVMCFFNVVCWFCFAYLGFGPCSTQFSSPFVIYCLLPTTCLAEFYVYVVDTLIKLSH